MKALALIEILLVTADLDRAVRFYADGLGFAPGPRAVVEDLGWLAVLGLHDRHVQRQTMRLGAQHIVLLSVEPAGAPYPPDSTATDLWFQHLAIVVSAMPDAFAQVMAAGAQPISRSGPQQLPPATGSVQAFKFRDPDGHPLELLHFPEGTGAACWHAPSPALFQGIDHSAVAVSATAALEVFYRDTLALSRASASLNHGPAQARLDDLPADRVDVVALTAADVTPHLELLGYRTGSRRAIPAPSDAADIAATRLVFQVDALPAGAPGVATLRDGTRAIALQDPDGHRMIARDG